MSAAHWGIPDILTILEYNPEAAKEIPFPKGESAIRMYELSARTPKLEQLVKIAKALDISVYSLIFPDLKVHGKLVKALYYCDFNVKIVKNENGKLCVEFNNSHINNDLKYWYEIQQKYFNGKISKDDYNK